MNDVPLATRIRNALAVGCCYACVGFFFSAIAWRLPWLLAAGALCVIVGMVLVVPLREDKP